MRPPHEILGVTPNASPDEIRRAYRAKAREHHPDATGRPETAERFAELTRAYEAMLRLAEAPPGATRPHATPAPTPDEPEEDPEPVYDAFFGTPGGQQPRTRRRADRFTRRPGGLDLEIVLPVSRAETIAGGQADVPSPWGGQIRVRIPPGADDGHEIRVPGRGVRGGGGETGDLVVVLRRIEDSGGVVAGPDGSP